MHRFRVFVATLAAGLLAAATLSSPAAAGPSGADRRAGWERAPSETFTSPAGDLCPFAFRSVPLVDRVYVRTTSTFADGTPRRQEYVGPLVVRVTNLATGDSVVRSLSGSAVVTYAADGSFDFLTIGPAAFGFRSYVGDPEPTGYYVLRGVHVVHFAPGGRPHGITVDRGTEEDLCTTLA